jgi:3-oxoacyl-[acyl-carrier protein] reductase
MRTCEMVGRVAVVTGGAGGIGSAICRAFAEAGAHVAVGYFRSAGQAAELAEALPRRDGQDHAALAAPVTDSAALAALARAVDARWGRCDVLVNCAGTTCFVPHADLDALDDETIDAILATNVRGAFAAVRALRSLLAKGDGGLVVNVSSVAARTATGSNVIYCASKAALDNMTCSLARALAPRIRVVSVSPGLVETDFIANLDDGWRAEQVARTPLGRLAAPADIAYGVVALATNLSFVTGAVLPIDGGRPLA